MKRPDGGSEAARAGFDRMPYIAAAMRHELCGALNSMAMMASLLGERAKKGTVGAQEVGDLATRLGRQVDRATAIVDHYLEFVAPSDSESLHESESDDESTDGEAVAEAFANAKHEAEARGVQMSIRLGPRPPRLAMPLVPLRFALGRVFAFIARRTREGGEIRVRTHSEEGDYVIEVDYDGAPMAADDLHVFERGPGISDEGLIDLAVVRRLLSEAGGELSPRMQSFRLRLPGAAEGSS